MFGVSARTLTQRRHGFIRSGLGFRGFGFGCRGLGCMLLGSKAVLD